MKIYTKADLCIRALREAGFNPDNLFLSLTVDGKASEFYTLRDEIGNCPNSGNSLLKEIHTAISDEMLASVDRFREKKPPKLVGAFMGRAFYVDAGMPQEDIDILMRRLACSS